MARRAKDKKNGAQTVLLARVTEEAPRPQAEEEAATEEERRALEVLESIERDLFGASAHTRRASTPPTPTVPPAVSLDTEGEMEDEEEFEVREIPPLTAPPVDPEEAELPPAENAEEEVQGGEDKKPGEFREKPLIESSGEDFSLLLQMDYEDELGNAIGFEKIRSYHEKELNGRTATRNARRAGKEFETPTQDVYFRRAYARKRTSRILHLCFSLLLLVLTLIYERPQFMARAFGGPLDGGLYPTSYILFGIQLLVFNIALSYRSLWEGFVRLVRFSPVDYSLSSVLVLATLIYHVVLLFLPHASYPALYLSPTALCLTLLSLVELLNWYRESLAFEVVAARHQRYAMVSRVSVGGKQGSAKERLLHDEGYDNMWYARPVGFVRDYFLNTSKHMEHHRNLGTQLLLTAAVGVAFGLFAVAGGNPAERVWLTVFATVLLCTPATSLLLTALPMFFASLLRLQGDGAIIGEEPIASCRESMTLVLPAGEIFSAMEHAHFRLKGGCDAHRVSVLVRALLEKVNSPLANAFSVDPESRLNPTQMELIDVNGEGVSAKVGKYANCIHLGSAAYMAQHNIDVGSAANVAKDGGGEERATRSSAQVLFVAVDGIVAAAFLVRYRLAEGVEALIRELDKSGACIGIRTMDPCVREDVMYLLLPRLQHPIKVLKPTLTETEMRADRVSSTIVAQHSCMEVARTYAACRRIGRVGVWGKWLQMLVMLLGGGLAGLLTVLGRAPSAFIVTVWLLLWCVVYGGISYLSLRRPSDGREEQ